MNKVTFFLVALAFTGITSMQNAYSQTTVIDSGTCGDSLTWIFTSDSTLTISGSGAMDDYTITSYIPLSISTPWDSYRNSINAVVIEDNVTSIGNNAFYECEHLISVTIGNSVTTIGDVAFGVCRSLTSVTIPNSVTTIGANVFYYSRLITATIGNSVTTIGYGAFMGCFNLSSITIPNSVTMIGEHAFYNCLSLNFIICEAITPPIIHEYTFIIFEGFTGIIRFITAPVYVPCKSMNAYKTANYWSDWSTITNFIGMPDTTFIFDTICQGMVYNNNGFIVNGTGVYYRTETIANNCDSVICLALSEYILVPVTSYSAIICQDDAYSDDNFTNLTQAGTYYDTLQNIDGCDSIVCLNLSYYPNIPLTSYSAIICQGESYSDANFTNLTDHGIYYATLQNVNGCDSVVQFFLTVYRTYNTQISDSICAGDSYNFFGKLLTADGIYYDTLQTIHGCDSIIELMLTITGVGIVETDNYPSLPRIYPNPSTGKLKIESGELKIGSIDIFDVVGRTVGVYPCGHPKNTIEIDISHLSAGMYFIKINGITKKIVKK